MSSPRRENKKAASFERPRPFPITGFVLFDHDTGTRAQTQERRLSPSLRFSRCSIIVIQLAAVPARSQSREEIARRSQ
jgi:hypothetical protein